MLAEGGGRQTRATTRVALQSICELDDTGRLLQHQRGDRDSSIARYIGADGRLVVEMQCEEVRACRYYKRAT